MPIDKSDVFTKSFVFRKVQRRIKDKMAEVAGNLSVEDFGYAVERNIDILGYYLERSGMSQQQRRKKIKPWEALLSVITDDDMLALINEVSPAHAQVLTNHRLFFCSQMKKLREDLELPS